MNYSLLLKQDEQVEVKYELPKKLEAPVKKGQQVGRADYMLHGQLLREYPIYAKQEVRKITYGWCLEQIGKQYKI